MKKILGLFFLLIIVFSNGCSKRNPFHYEASIITDKRLDGFYDMKWGSSMESVKDFMDKRKVAEFNHIMGNDMLTYSDGSFAGLPVDSWWFEFHNNQLASVRLTLKKGGGAKQWSAIVKTLQGKYGERYVSYSVDTLQGYPNLNVRYLASCHFYDKKSDKHDELKLMIIENDKQDGILGGDHGEITCYNGDIMAMKENSERERVERQNKEYDRINEEERKKAEADAKKDL